MLSFSLFNIPVPITLPKTVKNPFREPLWFLGHLGQAGRFPQFSPIQLSKELNSLELNSIIFNLRQEEIFQDFPQNFLRLSKKKGKFFKTVITLKGKAVKSKALRVKC